MKIKLLVMNYVKLVIIVLSISTLGCNHFEDFEKLRSDCTAGEHNFSASFIDNDLRGEWNLVSFGPYDEVKVADNIQSSKAIFDTEGFVTVTSRFVNCLGEYETFKNGSIKVSGTNKPEDCPAFRSPKIAEEYRTAVFNALCYEILNEKLVISYQGFNENHPKDQIHNMILRKAK